MASEKKEVNWINEINTLDIPDSIKKGLTKELKALKKKLTFAEFKIKRTINDKNIATNILNQTIISLEEKSLAITKQAEQLEEQSKFKEELFANVSHELRTPLHGILGMSHLLGKTEINNVQNEYVGVIKSSADNLLVIINDILSLSQINAGKIEITEEPFSLNHFLKELESMLHVRTEQKGLKLTFLTAPNVPEFLIGDRTRVFQVLLNLLNNAIKFTHKGYILLSTELVICEEQKIELQFDLKDTGIGMKQDTLTSIFESFTRVHEEKGVVYEGAGLGLNIVKNLLSMMNGSIEVESEINKGTLFKVRIPFQIPDSSLVEAFKESEQDATIPSEWKKKRFLMIEDNSANILYGKDIFETWGLELDIAKCIAEAEVLLDNKYDCILSDVKLPDGDGLNHMIAMRKNSKAINQVTPVIILTASASENGVALSKEAAIQSYLSKPFPPELLVTELKKVFVNNDLKSIDVEPKKNKTVAVEEELFKGDLIDIISKKFRGRKNLMVEMCNIFLDQAPQILKIVEMDFEKVDAEAVRFEAHKFKSTTGIVGLMDLQKLASEVESIFYDGKPEVNQQELLDVFSKQIKIEIQNVKDVVAQVSESETTLV